MTLEIVYVGNVEFGIWIEIASQPEANSWYNHRHWRLFVACCEGFSDKRVVFTRIWSLIVANLAYLKIGNITVLSSFAANYQ